MKRIVQIFGGIVLILILLFGVFLLWISQTDYTPEPVESLKVVQRNQQELVPDSLEFFIWNIGYAGLGEEMDFFYEGGKKVRADELSTRKNIENIKQFMQQHPVDFWLLQEVDFKSKRSYSIDQEVQFSLALPDYNHVKAINYNVPFVPVPFLSPMGRVYGGIVTFSTFVPRLAKRYAYPQIASWPERLFLLDRCFIETRFSLVNGAELIVLNTHNSAFITEQNLMQMELDVIYKKMLHEYESGNYVVAGGVWNMNPPNYIPSADFSGHFFAALPVAIPENLFPEEWNISFDTQAPSNRFVDEAYRKGKTRSTTIDFFITSPNIQVVRKELIDLGFENSDHNPVRLQIVLQ